MNERKYKCPHCGKLRPVDPSTYKVGDVVYVNRTTQTTTKSANRIRISCRASGYDGVIEDILADGKAVVRRGFKGYGKLYVVDITDLTLDGAPSVSAYILMGECKCSQQLNDSNEQDTHNH